MAFSDNLQTFYPGAGKFRGEFSGPKSVGFFLLMGLLLTYITEVLSFVSGHSLSSWVFPCGLLADGLVCFCLLNDVRKTISCIAIGMVVILVALLISHLTMDYSWDGNFYHQETVARLMEGWNPYVGQLPAGEISLWTIHYAKCIEMLGAAIALTTGSIEAGKAVNFILIAATTFFVYDFFRQRWNTVRNSDILLFTAFIICNPVGICQCFTFYIDYTKYYYIILTILSAAALSRKNTIMDYLVFAAVIILAIGTKFNIFFEEGIVVIAILFWLYATRQRKLCNRLLLCAFIAAIAGLALNYHPYVTNYFAGGNPFYPLVGENAVDIMTTNTPEIYEGHNRVTNFFISLFANEIPKTDRRLGGFGVLMPLMILTSLVVLLYYRRRIRPVLFYAAGWVLLSCFFFEQSWWARYICQLWLIPVIGLIVMMTVKSKVNRYLKWGMLGCGLVTAVLSFSGVFYSLYTKGCFRECIFSVTEDATIKIANASPQVIRHFHENRTKVVPVETDDLVPESSVYYYGEEDPDVYPIVELSPAQLGRLYETGRKYHLNIDKHRLKP